MEWGAGGVAPCGGDPAPPCSIVRGDQSDEAFLQSFIHQVSCDWWRAMLSPDWWQTGGNFTVIIDDGSHLPSHQLLSLETLWPSLAPGGLYIVEDVETSYWAQHAQLYGYSYIGQPSIVDRLKLVADAVNRRDIETCLVNTSDNSVLHIV